LPDLILLSAAEMENAFCMIKPPKRMTKVLLEFNLQGKVGVV
jgi:hypothetical protein